MSLTLGKSGFMNVRKVSSRQISKDTFRLDEMFV